MNVDCSFCILIDKFREEGELSEEMEEKYRIHMELDHGIIR